MASPLPILHIGLPKTATTMLQRQLFSQHSAIDYLGRINVKTHADWDSCRDQDVREIMRIVNSNRSTDSELQGAAQGFLSLTRVSRPQPGAVAGSSPVWSSRGNRVRLRLVVSATA